MQSERSPIVAALLALLLVVAFIAGCSSDSDGTSDADASVPAAQDGPDAGDDGDEEGGDDDSGDAGDADATFEGEPRGTIEIDGVSAELSLVDPGAMTSYCRVDEKMVSVAGMATPDGVEVIVAGGDVWSAAVTSGGDEWVAASHDPEVGSDATRQIEPGKAVIEGTWGADSGSGETAEIRLELLCPPSD